MLFRVSDIIIQDLKMLFERFSSDYRSKREQKKLRVSRADLKKSEKIPQILASWTLATGLRIRAGGGMCYAERKPVCVRPYS